MNLNQATDYVFRAILILAIQSAGKVVEAIKGPIHINRCLKDHDYCSKKGAPECQVHQALESIQKKLADELKKHNFGEFLK